MAQTKSELRHLKAAKAIRISPRGLKLHKDTVREWVAWHREGYASLWSDTQRAEAERLIRLIDAFNTSDDNKELTRLMPVIRAGKKLLGLDKPSPLPEAAPADKSPPAKRKDPRLDARQ
jgi:hypothetical protein